MIEAIFAADDPRLLGLAFEAARLPDGRVLALQRPVVTLRRPLTSPAHTPHAPLAGPLKILLAVAAPDAAQGGGPLLDYEQETQNVLDAVRDAQTLENCQVRVLEVGHPKPIAEAFKRDAYHVLHLSCHGGPGVLELEDEDGKRVATSPEALLDPILETQRPLPLVLLNACHGGVAAAQTASFAQALLEGGAPAVLAMQAPVSDAYAIRLADVFYRELAKGEPVPPSVALARARKAIEGDRQAAIGRGAPAAETQPEYATPALFVADTDRPVADFHLTRDPLGAPPVHVVGGVVPQLSLGELIGRRKELRAALGVLRDPARRQVGVVLTGIGGIGKSALAGRIMCRRAEQGWVVPAVRGIFSLTKIAEAIGAELLLKDPASKPARALISEDLPDPVRAQLLADVLATQPVLLVLDDFEQNLTLGGDAFLDPDARDALGTLADQARTGRLLLTCRYPLPGLDGRFATIAVPPLSTAETRKKLLRLSALSAQLAAGGALPRSVAVGHPRLLELLDALLVAAPQRRGAVAKKLSELAIGAGLDTSQPAASLDAAAQDALALAGRDVLLPELLEVVRREGIEAALLQAAVSSLPVSAAGLARMLAEDGPGDVVAAEAALARLAALSLLHRDVDGAALVHRWTAEGFWRVGDTDDHRARCRRAAAYRLWRINNESHVLDDAVEALRNLLTGRLFDNATPLAQELLQLLSDTGQSVAVAALAAEVLETLPLDDDDYAPIADAEATAHIALGFSDRALRRYRALREHFEQLTALEPNNNDHKHSLSLSHQRIGEIYRTLGQHNEALELFTESAAIAESLANAAPDLPRNRRHLAAAYQRLGNINRMLGNYEQARDALVRVAEIVSELAASEPNETQYQVDLGSVWCDLGDTYNTLGDSEAAHDAHIKALDLRKKVARAEPGDADHQRELSVSYDRMGNLYYNLGQYDVAREAYAESLGIAEQLARAEPDRADYQRDLSVSYAKMGDLNRRLGNNEAARELYLKGLAIMEHLARAEPDRVDHQRDLVGHLVRLAQVSAAVGSRAYLQRAVGVVEALQGDGRSNPEDVVMLPALRRILDALPD